jgi:hypothetical protein
MGQQVLALRSRIFRFYTLDNIHRFLDKFEIVRSRNIRTKVAEHLGRRYRQQMNSCLETVAKHKVGEAAAEVAEEEVAEQA